MTKSKKLLQDIDTLAHEAVKAPRRRPFLRTLAFLLTSVVFYVFCFWIYNGVLGLEKPKTYFLKRKNAEWTARVDLLDHRLDQYEETLNSLAQRDNDVYRSVFGMNEIPDGVRNAGIVGDGRFVPLSELADSSLLKVAALRLDVLTKKAYIQSRSYDEISALAMKSGDMVTCVPSIPPMVPDDLIQLTSTFGYRIDPNWGGVARHTGIDLATDTGNPVYSTGDGVVEEVVSDRNGYGKYVVVDHGFGYKSRYAHLDDFIVEEGQVVKRGQHIGYSGNSGKTTGAHLHYEVIYRNNYVNPLNYMDLDIPLDDYRRMVTVVPRESGTTARKRR